MSTTKLNLALEAEEDDLWQFAQFLKRVGFTEFRALARNDEEAYQMQAAGEKLRAVLAEKGFGPR
jgi:GTP cyclohydrolase II